MSELDEPGTSPEEAARVLSNARWGRNDEEQSPAPEGPQHFGLEATERSQNFAPMTVANPVQKELADEPVDSAELGKKILAFEAQVAEPVERGYVEIGGENPGRPIDQRRTVSAEQAARDVAAARESELTAFEEWDAKQVQDAIDALRADQQPAQEQVSRPEPQANPQAPAEQQPTAQADDPVVRALQDPKVLAAFNDELGKHSARADQIERHYAAVTAANAASAYQHMMASFPEIANVRPDQIGVALQVLAQSNPQRAQQIAGHIQKVTQLTAEAQKAEQTRQEKDRQYRQLLWQHDAAEADQQFDTWANENLPGQADAIKNETIAMLEEYGLGRDQIAYHWNTNPLFRSFPAQRLMADAARYRMAQRQINAKKSTPVPTVQKPGSPLARGSEQEWSDRRLNARIDNSTGRDQLRAAAELVAQRRARNAR